MVTVNFYLGFDLNVNNLFTRLYNVASRCKIGVFVSKRFTSVSITSGRWCCLTKWRWLCLLFDGPTPTH